MFEPPVTLLESKKQKTVFDDVDGSKVIAYLEKDSPGTVMEIFEGERGGISQDFGHFNGSNDAFRRFEFQLVLTAIKVVFLSWFAERTSALFERIVWSEKGNGIYI